MSMFRHARWLACAPVYAMALHAPAVAQSSTAAGSISGQVVDLVTGEPLREAKIATADGTRKATTDAEGRFRLDGLAPGMAVELRISLVGYGLLKRRVEVAAARDTALQIRLGQETLRATEQVTVNAAPFEPAVASAPSQYDLNSGELHDLGTILAEDPFRAVANLPGVNNNDDYYAAFSVRGAGPDRVGTFIDGVLVDHPDYVLEDSGDLGSLSMVNGDTLQDLSLLSGNFPARYGNRTGAVLDVETREGARDRTAVRAMVGVLGVELSAEGPAGRRRNASWLLAGRQSYLGYLLSRLGYSTSLSLGYRDLDGSYSWDATPHHRFAVTGIAGMSYATRKPIFIDNEQAALFTSGSAQHVLGIAKWDWTIGPNVLLRTEGYGNYDHEYDTNAASGVNLDTNTKSYGFRSDFDDETRHGRVQAGVEVRQQSQYRYSATLWNYPAHTLAPGLVPFDQYAGSATQPGAYLGDALPLLHNRVKLTVAGRWAYFSPTGRSVWLPQASAAVHVASRSTFTVAAGQYAQMPSLRQLEGAFGTPDLQAQRSTQTMAAFEQMFSEKLRLRVELYDREERHEIFSPQTEFRLLANGQVGFPTLGPVLNNGLKGYSRGFEITLQRRSADRLSGWLAYSRNYTRFWVPGTAVSFVGDFDQRDSATAYASYRLTPTISLSVNARAAAGLPVAGYYAGYGPEFVYANNIAEGLQLGQFRNQVRQPKFLRGDVRVSKEFVRRHYDLTVHAEVENLTDHDNYALHRFIAPGNIGATKTVDAIQDRTLPLLPAAGLVIDF